jgi:hypothetical protein
MVQHQLPLSEQPLDCMSCKIQQSTGVISSIATRWAQGSRRSMMLGNRCMALHVDFARRARCIMYMPQVSSQAFASFRICRIAATIVQDSHHNEAVFTMVWGTDINVTDVQQQFSQFVRGYRRQKGCSEDGVPILEDEPKYMAYLQDVRAGHSKACIHVFFECAHLEPPLTNISLSIIYSGQQSLGLRLFSAETAAMVICCGGLQLHIFRPHALKLCCSRQAI